MPPIQKVEKDAKAELLEYLETHVPIEDAPIGIHFNIAFERYCEIRAINHSRLCRARDSLLHFKHIPERDDSPAFAFGSLAHTGRLEPEQLAQRYVVIPDFHLEEANVTAKGERSDSKMTGYYKGKLADFKKLHPDKQEVSVEWMQRMKDMIQNLDDHPVAGKLFAQGVSEVTIIWDDKKTGLRCKARLDWVSGPTPGMTVPEFIKAAKAIVDLKTTEDIIGFNLSKFNYHTQAGMYLEGWKTLTKKITPFFFAAAEKSPPHAIRCAPASQAAVKTGQDEVAYLLGQVKQAQETDEWPGPVSPKEWELDQWYKPMSFVNHQGQ